MSLRRFALCSVLVALATLPFAPARANEPLFGVSSGLDLFDTIDNALLSIDPVTGNATPLGDITGYDTVNALAYDPNTGTLYAVNSGLNVQAPADNVLLSIDPTDGTPTLIGQLGASLVNGLAFDPTTNTLYGVEAVTDQLLTIDTSNGDTTPVGDTGFEVVTGLTFDPADSTLYGVDNSSDELLTINPFSGDGTAVGPLNLGGLLGVTFDTDDPSRLFGVDNVTDTLVAIDKATGNAVGIGPLGFDNVLALAAVPEPAFAAVVLPALGVALRRRA